jgi:uncharacterized protein (TIGR02996 family)
VRDDHPDPPVRPASSHRDQAVSEFAAFVAALLEDPDGAGAFADFLDERGDPRGTLLRRRWRRWLKDRAAALAAEEQDRAQRATRWGRIKSLFRSLVAPPKRRAATAAVDATFRKYIRRKFASEAPEPSPRKRLKK